MNPAPLALPPALPLTPPATDAPVDGVEVFRRLLLAVSVLAAGIHIAFIGLFHAAGVTLLAGVNVASVLCYVLAFAVLRRGQVLAGISTMAGEVVAHAVLASVLIGWDSGFHYYIILVVPVVLLSTLASWRVKLPLAAGVLALYVGLAAVLRNSRVPYPLERFMLDGLHLFNVATMLVLLAALASYYFILINRAEAALRRMATTDPLTQLSNRRHLLAAGQAEVGRLQRYGRPLAVILADVDHFKAINDRHGHDVGDAVLCAVSRALQRGLRNIDHVGRWGGEEFLMLLPETSLDGALQLAERLRQDVSRLRPSPEGDEVALTMTFGVAAVQPGDTLEEAIARADHALLGGKRDGRNRVVAG